MIYSRSPIAVYPYRVYAVVYFTHTKPGFRFSECFFCKKGSFKGLQTFSDYEFFFCLAILKKSEYFVKYIFVCLFVKVMFYFVPW